MNTVLERVNAVLDDIQLAADWQKYNHRGFFTPYQKQIEFCDMGGEKRERLLSAGNQLGKSEVGAFEVACHLTGEYPDWWLGKRFDNPVKCWAGGVTGIVVRDIMQKKLCGEPGVEEAFGTGMIPKSAFVGKPTMARGTPDLYDTVLVRHKSGGISILKFKTYEQGREKWQGETLDFIWFDEEPPEEIYNEGLMRLTGSGMAFMTFTPLKGSTKVTQKFFDTPTADQGLVMMTVDDITHWTDEEKQKRMDGTPKHEIRTRFYGEIAQGEGAVFRVPIEQILEDAIPFHLVPKHWVWLWGIDFGVGHPFAGVLIVWDKDTDTIHVVHAFKVADAKIIEHVARMKPFGWIKVAWPQDGTQRDRGDLTPLAMIYKREGLWMMDGHAKFEDGSNSTEAGVAEMDARMISGRFKVAKHLLEWQQEFSRYHRKDGLIVKQNDDIMSATRVAVMAKRNAAVHMPAPGTRQKGKVTMADGVDFDLFG